MLIFLGFDRRLIDKFIILKFDFLKLSWNLHKDALIFTFYLRILLFLLLEFLLTRLNLSPQSIVLFIYLPVDLLIALFHLHTLVLQSLLQLTRLLLQLCIHVLTLFLQLPDLLNRLLARRFYVDVPQLYHRLLELFEQPISGSQLNAPLVFEILL
jgi:hypothetical protein